MTYGSYKLWLVINQVIIKLELISVNQSTLKKYLGMIYNERMPKISIGSKKNTALGRVVSLSLATKTVGLGKKIGTG